MATLTKSFIIANGIKRMILDAFGATTACGMEWDLDKFIEYIKNDESVKNEFDIYDLTTDEMELLGFGKIKDKPYRTIPAWLYHFLPEDLPVIPEGSKDYVLIKKSAMDKELVVGCFKYGILPSDAQGKVEIKENKNV